MTLNGLNDEAQKRFVALRHKLKLDVQQPALKKAVTLTQEHIDKMSENKSDINHARATFDGGVQEAVEAARNIDLTFNFIDNLHLPPQLSLAIGLIISGYKTDNLEDLNKAWCEIKDFTTDKWNEKYAKKERETKINNQTT